MDMLLSAGKSRKNVDAYVLLPPDAKEAIELLNSNKGDCDHSKYQPILFARVNSDTPLSGNEDLKEILDLCPGLIHPKRITSTGLRRYIATVSQIFDWSESELDDLARHLLSHATKELTVKTCMIFSQLLDKNNSDSDEDSGEDSGTSKCGRKVQWSYTEETLLRKSFKYYINGNKTSVHNIDMIMAQNTCSESAKRTLAQIIS